MTEQIINVLFTVVFGGMFALEFHSEKDGWKHNTWLVVLGCALLIYIIRIVTH